MKKTEEIIRGNVLLARFMGNEPHISGIYDNRLHNFPVEHSLMAGGLCYDESWDWLMPVVNRLSWYGVISMSVGEGNVCVKFQYKDLFWTEHPGDDVGGVFFVCVSAVDYLVGHGIVKFKN